jgi:hypothetical protein
MSQSHLAHTIFILSESVDANGASWDDLLFNPAFNHLRLIFTEEFTKQDHDPLRTLSYLSQTFNESSLTFIIELNRSLEDREPRPGLGSRRGRSRETELWRSREVDDGEGKKVWLSDVCIVVLLHCYLALQ